MAMELEADAFSNMTEQEMATAKAHFLWNIRQLNHVAVLLKKNADGTLEAVFVSDSYAKMMECTVEEALKLVDGKGFFYTTHQDDRVYVRRMIRRRVSEDGTRELTIRKITSKGNQIWCNVRYSFIDDYDEHYIYCTYFDVTSLKEYEERLRLSYMNMGDNFYHVGEHTLGMLRANLTRDGIEDIQGRDLYGTDSMVYHYSEIIKKRASNYIIFEERMEFLEKFSREHLIESYEAGNMVTSVILYSRRSMGHFCYVNITANVTRHPLTGDLIAFITEQECNEEKVNQTLFDKILVRQFDMVAYLSEGNYGVIIGDNDLIGKGSIFPLTKAGEYRHYLEAQVFPVLSGTEEKKEAMMSALMPEAVERSLMTKSPYVVNIAIEIDGEIYYKRFDFYSVDPEAKFYIILKSDTTDIQKEQMEFNEQLKNALSEAEQANVAKTAFLSRMSHEIRTPMNAIIGLDNIALKEPSLSFEVKQDLDKIGASARYLLTLINDILDMSRIESGRMTLRNEEFSLESLLDQINTIVDGQCRDKGLHYDCVIHGKVDELYIGDDTKLKQVLINILGNAVKFTEPGGTVSLKVQRTAQFENQTVLQFVITDTGIGMEQEYLPKIFEAFSQEDETNTSAYGGSGLGLAITRNIVKMMNGDIAVESEKGVGSVFTVEVTLKNTAHHATSKKYDIRPQDLKVLVIDDDPVACRHAQIVLEEIGVAAETCLSGEEAVKLIELNHARRQEYNLILIDLRMPEKDGVQLTREIREIIGHETGIVILTAYNWSEIEEEAKDAGVDNFMSKPLFASSVLYEFQQALQKKNAKASDEKPMAELAGKRVLLAEDMVINAEIMKQVLVMRNMEVDHVENGQMAVEAFKNSSLDYYDAVLMDVRMPVMDGLAATEAIRALDRIDAKDVPIIALTANAFDEDVQRSLQAGMNAHLSKPVEPDHLYTTLEQLIGEREANF